MAACNIPTDYYSLWKCIGSRHPYPHGAFFCVCVCLPQRHDLDATDWIHAHWIGVRERTSTNWILNGEETCSPLSQNVR